MVADNIKIFCIFIQQLFYQKIHFFVCVVGNMQGMTITVGKRLQTDFKQCLVFRTG